MALKSTPRIVLSSIASLLLIILLNTCGLETFIQLNPPEVPEQASENLVSFIKKTYNNEPQFTGFDLYYKFYGQSGSDDIVSDVNAIIEFEDLAARKFRRIHDSKDDLEKKQIPLIIIDLNDRYPDESPPAADHTNDEFTLSLYLSGAPTDPSLPEWLNLTTPIKYPIIVDDGNTDLIDGGEHSLPGPVPILIEITDVRRDVYDSDSKRYKTFSNFSGNDSDIQGIDVAFPVTLVLYVISYGLDVFGGTFRDLHSEPVRLGIIDGLTITLSE